MSIRWYQNTIKLWLNFQLLTGNISFVPPASQPAGLFVKHWNSREFKYFGKNLISKSFKIKLIDNVIKLI